MKKNNCSNLKFLNWKLGIALTFVGSSFPPSSYAATVCNSLFEQTVAAQSIIRGKVIDAIGNPIVGATITEKGTSNSVTTNNDGMYSLQVKSENSILVISFMGFISKEVVAETASVITLEDKQDELEEVVVVGYGAQKKSDLTGSISTVSSKELQNINSPNIVDKIQGKVAGLTINTGNAAPGETAYINIRGENSISASNGPLIILDGIPYSGTLGDISPNNIENISVLKDASSTAIYGSRAANGVILITTKRGASGLATVNYNGYFGVQNVERRLDLMDGKEYLRYLNDYHVANGATGNAIDPDSYLFAYVKEQLAKGEEIDWQDQVFTRNAPIQEHQVSFSGGTENSNYYASVGYLNQQGVLKNTPFERYNLALNLNQNLRSWLKLGLNTQLNQNINSGVAPSIENAIKLSPYSKDRDENGKVYYYPMYAQTLYQHPFANENAISERTQRAVYANTFLDILLPIQGLSFKTTFGTNFRGNENGSYYGSNTLAGQGVSGYGTIRNTNTFDWTWENLLTYNRVFGDHKLNVVGLYSAQKYNQKYAQLYGEDFVVDNSYHNMSSAAKNQKIESGLTNTALLSYMGRINYGYKDRYLLTVTGRSDGYSAFSQDNKWAFFPSIAGAWVISQEDFFQSEQVNNLKLRLSYGENGNQAISPYQTYDRLSKEPYIFGDGSTPVNGLIMGFSAIGNKSIKWETTRSLNAGLDFGLFNNKLSGNIDFYKTNTFDLLLNEQVPIMNGFNTILNNIGRTSNIGIESTLTSRNIQKSDFSWNTTLTFAYNKNKIVELNKDGKDDVANAWFVGQPIRVFYDYKVVGYWTENDDIANSHQPAAKPGHAKLADIDGDGKITAADRVVMGNKLPVYTIGLGNDFTYKNWSFSIFMNGAFDVTKEDNFVNIERFLPNSGANYISDMNYWTAGNLNPSAPSPAYVPVNNHSYYLNASYWRIRDFSVGYTFKGEQLEKLNIGSIRTFINGRNLYTFSKLKGYNVEALAVNSTTGNPTTANTLNPYPSARVFSFGVNVQF